MDYIERSYRPKLKKIKVKASNGFISTFYNIKSSDSSSINDPELDEYNRFFYEGINKLKLFVNKKNDEILHLKEAAFQFKEAQKLKQTKVEPYYFLAYIFYMMKRDEVADHYLEIVEGLDPHFNGLKMLKFLINVPNEEIFHNKSKLSLESIKEKMKNTPKATAKTSSFKKKLINIAYKL